MYHIYITTRSRIIVENKTNWSRNSQKNKKRENGLAAWRHYDIIGRHHVTPNVVSLFTLLDELQFSTDSFIAGYS